MESSKAYWRFLFLLFLVCLITSCKLFFLVLYLCLFIASVFLHVWFHWLGVCFCFCFFFFGLVRSGLIMLVMFCVYLFILLQLCNWYIRAYIHLSIHILYFDISDIITLFLYHSILDRVSSQKCKTRQLTWQQTNSTRTYTRRDKQRTSDKKCCMVW